MKIVLREREKTFLTESQIRMYFVSKLENFNQLAILFVPTRAFQVSRVDFR